MDKNDTSKEMVRSKVMLVVLGDTEIPISRGFRPKIPRLPKIEKKRNILKHYQFYRKAFEK